MKNQLLLGVLSPEPPATLYHYTTQEGLLGIVQHKHIWATHTQYLNDRLEYLHAVGMVRDELKVMRDATTKDSTIRHLDEMAEGIDGIESMNVCVCSFSEVSDSLPQWRAYGEASAGFSIGFPSAFLREVGQSNDFNLVRCVYEYDEQVRIVRALLEEVLAENITRGPGDDEGHLPLGGNLKAYLHQYAPILKDASFSEEREWRLISRPMNCSRDGYDYRTGHSMLIPYFQLPLFKTDLAFNVDEVVVGPTPNPSQSFRSVSSLLVSEGLHLCDGKFRDDLVRSSSVPFRAW